MLNLEQINQVKKERIILDANILMCGIEQHNNPLYSFRNMQECYMNQVFSFFGNIVIHEAVLLEIGRERAEYVGPFIGNNVTIVGEDNLYANDPVYTDIFNAVARYDLFDYDRSSPILVQNPTKNRGDVFTLAYAAYHKIPYCSSRDGAVISAVRELPELKNVSLVGFEYCLALGYISNLENPDIKKRIKALYKYYCASEINRGTLPANFGEFMGSFMSN